jgi:hypothetical protein
MTDIVKRDAIFQSHKKPLNIPFFPKEPDILFQFMNMIVDK